MTEAMISALSQTCDDDPIRVLFPILHVLWSGAVRIETGDIKASGVPREDDRVVFGNIFVATKVFIVLTARMIIVGDQREGPARKDIFAIK